MEYFEWPTNKYDLKPEWPQYVKNFSQKYTQEEKDKIFDQFDNWN